MASFDLLEELKLKAYYPQKITLSEAIKLRGETQNGRQDQYGLDIVRRLLMFDSMAVISLTAELNDRLNKTDGKQGNNNAQSVLAGSKQPQNVWNFNTVPAKRRLNPMDLLVTVMNCCDDFLRVVLVEKMFVNKLSIPILLPDLRNGEYRMLLLALRSLIPEIVLHDSSNEGSTLLNDTLVDKKTPVVSFIGLGKLHRSKSKLINELLGFNSFNTFFHRECPNGSAKRLVANGSIEAAWFQSEKATEEEFNCRFFTAFNLRGNGSAYPKQTQFLCQSSTLVIFMVESIEAFKKLYEKELKDVARPKTKIVICYISRVIPDEFDETENTFLLDLHERKVVFAVIYDWHPGPESMSDNELTRALRKQIADILNPAHGDSDQMVTYRDFIKSGLAFGFTLDEDQMEYKSGKESADKFIDLVLKLPPGSKQRLLPLQGQPWEKIGKLEREQRSRSHDSHQDEYLIAKKETEKRKQREIQCRSLIQGNTIAETFSIKFHLLQEKNLSYYLNSCKITLDARSRVITSNLMEQYKKIKQKRTQQREDEGEHRVDLNQMELEIENSTIGLEHILREHGQMYEAVISEEIRMKEELKKISPLTPDYIRNFPTIMARLLLMGQPLELMDGDTSNVPITWLKAVLDQINIMTNNAKVFVLSIIGVQSSGKSTLLNALFGLQFPSSSGRCTRGIYCHLVPANEKMFGIDFDYVLVVDTEGLGSSQFTGNSFFRDNELATFAIGLADVTIINMKGENWAEMKDILQVVAHGLIRIRKTKSELDLMPRCIFVHQNVPAADAEEKNQLGQEKQLMLLDATIKEAGIKEGFDEITKFDQVIGYDPDSHSWYFPDLWHGRPPKARISEDYIGKTSQLRQYLMQLMRTSSSKLTMSSFFYRMSDLWNAMLHNNFVLCYRNTREIMLSTARNDEISHEVDNFKNLNKLEIVQIRQTICSVTSIENLQAIHESILKEVNDAVEQNFDRMKATLQVFFDATDIPIVARERCDVSLNEIKGEELLRIRNETSNDLHIHMKKLENESDPRVKDLKARMADLEKCIDEANKDEFTDRLATELDKSWKRLIANSKKLTDNRINIVKDNILKTIQDSISELSQTKRVQLNASHFTELLEMPFVGEMPQVTENDIVQNGNFSANPMDFLKTSRLPSWVKNFVYSNTLVHDANVSLRDAHKKWMLQFQNQIDLESNASLLKQIMSEVGQLLGILGKESDVRTETDETGSALPANNSFTAEYIIRFIKFACHFVYNRSLEIGKRFISMTDPLADIDKRRERSKNICRQMSVEANIDGVSKDIFDFASGSFIRDLGELLKTELCQEDAASDTFKTKRAFLKTILTDLGQRAHSLSDRNGEKKNIFKEFMLYVEMGESQASKTFFFGVILKLLKEILTMENATESGFQKMVQNNVGSGVGKALNALRQAEANCNGCEKTYIENFKDNMNVTSEIDFRIRTLSGFTEAVIEKISILYSDFFSQANSLFETLACKDDKAAIRALFEKIMGCRERCPFCSAPCSQSLQQHPEDHRANHYPMGVGGTTDIWKLFANTKVTHDAAKEEESKPQKLALDTCQTMVGSRADIKTKATVKKYSKWYHKAFKWNHHSFKSYKEFTEYEKWDISYSQDHNTSLYWKWFMAQFAEELAEHYKAVCPAIPEAWTHTTWEEAEASLSEPDYSNSISKFAVEEEKLIEN